MPTGNDSAITFEVVGGEKIQAIDPDNIQWPPDTLIVVAKRANEVIGRSAIVQLPHIEGTWIIPEARGSTLAARLLRRVEEILRKAGKTHAFAFVDTRQPEVASYMERFGYELRPLIVYSKELKSCQ